MEAFITIIKIENVLNLGINIWIKYLEILNPHVFWIFAVYFHFTLITTRTLKAQRNFQSFCIKSLHFKILILLVCFALKNFAF